MKSRFIKAQALGNDFVIFHKKESPLLEKNDILKIADRNRGVGCDQLIVYYDECVSFQKLNVSVEFYNKDGSSAESCGNGTRCLIKLLSHKYPLVKEFFLKTPGGIVSGGVDQDGVTICLSPVDVHPLKADLFSNLPFHVNPVSVRVGNPHLVLLGYMPSYEYMGALGPQLEKHPSFLGGVNVSFAHIVSRKVISLTVWERGAGLTQACGTGACATAIAAMSQGLVDSPVSVEQKGGDLSISWKKEGVFMTGEANIVFEGTLLF